MGSTIIVRSGILEEPLLVTDKAQAVEIYDCNDDLVAIMHKVFNEDYWAVTTRKDDDWVEALTQLGYLGEALKKQSQQT